LNQTVTAKRKSFIHHTQNCRLPNEQVPLSRFQASWKCSQK